MILLRKLKLNTKNKIKFKRVGMITLVLLLGFFIFQKNISAKEKVDIIITEIMYNPEGSDSKKEWVEIFNASKEDIGLIDWILVESSKKDVKHKIKLEQGDKKIKPEKYAIIAENAGEFLKNHDDFKGSVFDSSFSLNNNNEKITIKNIKEDIGFSTEYFKKWGADGNGYSLELDDSVWRESYIKNGTPGKENSKKPDPIEYEKTIKINEIFPNPKKSPEGKYEFIELYNYGDNDVDLKNWKLEDKSGNNFELEDVLVSGKYLSFYGAVSLNNTGDKITLKNPNGEKVEKMEYKNSQEGFSYSFNKDKNKWEWSSFVTPGEKNKFDKKKKYSSKIKINEILPNPKGEENKDEFIELHNYGSKKIDLEKWILKDSSKMGKYVFSKNKNIKAGGFLKIYRKEFKFALNNSGKETVYLLDPNNKKVFNISYEGAKENISYGFDKVNNSWRWSRFLTPGVKNKFDKLPKIKIDIDDDVYKNIYADFKLDIKNANKDDLKVKWDFGDGRRSYKKEARHKYKEEGKYNVVTSVFNGSEDFEFKNIIKVKKFPRRDIKIISFIPNPEGKDIEGEWIKIKNNSKKKINLESWSIATGKDDKSLINHPINKKFKINPDDVEKITREYSYFSLNNKQGYVEIRYPDGKVADKIEYENKDGIKDDDIYQKNENGDWEWIVFNKTEDDTEVSQSQKPEVKGVNNEIFENLGKRSWIKVDKNKIFFNKYDLNSEILSFVWNSKGGVRFDGVNYHFNPVVKKQKHYIVKFFENIFNI